MRAAPGTQSPLEGTMNLATNIPCREHITCAGRPADVAVGCAIARMWSDPMRIAADRCRAAAARGKLTERQARRLDTLARLGY